MLTVEGRQGLPPQCVVCGTQTEYTYEPVLWQSLVEAWGLSEEEATRLDPRDGLRCTACQTQLRTMNLGLAVLRALGVPTPFKSLWKRRPLLRVLELNQCGSLRRHLRRRRMPRKVSGDFPEVDMQALPYRSGSFDLVVHGDTLEHVPEPVQGLRECLRVLRPGGALCYTVPVVTGRPTRRRDGLPPSYHGSESNEQYLVHTEYGDDFWQQPLEAGFGSVEIVSLQFPASFAVICRP